MSGHWEGDEHVLHDKSDHQSKQPKAPKNQVDRKPDDGSGYEGQPEVIATSAHGGAQEYDHDGRDPILPYQEPYQEKKEKNHQRPKHEDPSVSKERTERLSHAQQRFHRWRARNRRQASQKGKENIVHRFEHPEQDAISHANQNIAADERIANLPANQTHPANQRMGIAPTNKRLQSEIQHSRESGDEERPSQREHDHPKLTHGSKVMRLQRPHGKKHKVEEIGQTPGTGFVSPLLLDVSFDN